MAKALKDRVRQCEHLVLITDNAVDCNLYRSGCRIRSYCGHDLRVIPGNDCSSDAVETDGRIRPLGD